MTGSLSLHFGVASSPYITSENHKHLHDDWLKAGGPNIGADGVNLTITFLTMNRSGLSIRLCESIRHWIPGFAGEVLIIDNGSSSEEQRSMADYLKDFPFKWRMECLGMNYGVAGGRNRTIPFIRTEWLMSLDNDIYLISNPLKQLQADLARLGCHFLTLRLLNEDGRTDFLRGGHLYLDGHGDELFIGAGSAVAQTAPACAEGVGFLGTFLAGGASVYRKDSFLRMGGFDEGMFVGFEDIELSVRLFREGMKVGACDMPAFVHAHEAPQTNADRDYEKERFSRQRIFDAARYFERKHGYRVWSGEVSDWITQREKELGIDAGAANEALDALPNLHVHKPRIALIVDRPDWALANIAYQLEKWLCDEFEIFILSASECDHNVPLVAYVTRNYDLVHFFWRDILDRVFSEDCASGIDHYFGSHTEMRRMLSRRPTTFSVYDHLFLSREDIEARLSLFNDFSAGYTVSSNLLFNIYKNINGYPPPSALTTDGVDLERFHPSKLERFEETDERPLYVGWVGNSAWGEELLDDDPKGFKSILLPALERLKQEGGKVEGLFADRTVAFMPHHRMPDYYSKIDVLVCSSMIEGTPNPVLEAMACGVPVVSTAVGIVTEAFGPLQKQFILPERNIDSMHAALSRLNNERHLLRQLSAENLEFSRAWDWRTRAEAFRGFFRQMLACPRR